MEPRGECRSLNAVAAADKPEVWQDILSDMLVPMSISMASEARAGFRGRVRRQSLDDIAVVECRTDPFAGWRGRPEVSRGDEECLAVLIDVAGREYLSQADSTVDVRPGGGVVFSSSARFQFQVAMPYEKRFLLIPKSTLAHLEGVPKSGCVELNRRSPAVTLLNGYLGVLVSALPTMSAPSRAAARDAALALVAGALREDASVDVTTAVPALRASMDAWIERHLDDPGLSPEALASAHAVSVRTLYRLYRDDGDTFGAVVRERRLERARQDLASGERSVSAIAARWGFADASHLSRSFKKAFGVTPRDYRASGFGTGAQDVTPTLVS